MIRPGHVDSVDYVYVCECVCAYIMYIRVTKIIAEAMSLGGHLGGVGRGGARTKIDASAYV